MSKTCQRPGCDRGCYGDYCLQHKPRKPIPVRKTPRARTDRTLTYEQWRDTVAIPYLDRTFGRSCAMCGDSPPYLENGTWTHWAVDHKIKRSINLALLMDLSNVQYLCPPCHSLKDNHIVL